jgi:single-stranded-DNA-specific exonuclease
MRWLIRETDNQSVQQLADALRLPPLLCRMLVLREQREPAQARRFLNPELSHLHDPFLMRGMEDAVRRIFQAVERKEKILIYGDYDVDGTLAVVVLRMALSRIGADVRHHIPHRLREGYGMREEIIEQARQENVSLVISVDTGIRAFPVVERARQLGIDCIITDHHLPLDSPGPGDGADDSVGARHVVPQALAVLNPKQANCPYPNKNLCGAGVAFKLAQALLQTHPGQAGRMATLLPSFLKLVSIGTIADSVPLVGENRVIARLGLEGLTKPANHGLKALIEVSGLNGKEITAVDVGFRLAPRLNAAGRMENAQDAIELFTTPDAAGAQQIAQKLNRLNSERQKAEQEILEEIEDRQRQKPEIFSDYAIVVEGQGWHRGVMGIVASRIVDRFRRPALVISCEDGAGHGSGRSPENFHLLEALTACGDLFERFGGHACAAGFVVPVDRISELRRRLNEFAAERLRADHPEPELVVDAEVSLADLTPQLVQELEQLSPFGYGNPRPVFSACNIRLSGRPRLLQDKHLKFQVAQGGRTLDAIGWRKGGWMEKLQDPSCSLDLAFSPSLNYYQNQTTTQLELLDLISQSGS